MSQTATLDTGVLLLLVPITLLVCVYLLFRQRRRRLGEVEVLSSKLCVLEQRYAPLIDLDVEVLRLQSEIEAKQNEVGELRGSYLAKKEVFDQLRRQVAIFDEKLAFAEMGVYEPHFDFQDSEDYKREILACREKQKLMVSNKTAVVCPAN